MTPACLGGRSAKNLSQRTLASCRLFLVLLLAGGCAGDETAMGPLSEVPQRGGRLITTLRAETKTLNPVTAVFSESMTVIRLLHADLLHINQLSQDVEPALAVAWEVSADSRIYDLELRRDVQFSDGEPFDADDVLFTFEVHLDESVGSAQRDLLSPGGVALEISKTGSHSIRVVLAQPSAVTTRLFDGIAILPEHLLRASYEAGTLAQAWGVNSPPAEMAGLGPFRLQEYRPGDRVILERNPYYWKTGDDGQSLPYLDELVINFVPSDDAQALRFQAGEAHLIDRVNAESFDLLAREASGVRMVDAGPSLNREFVVLNVTDLGTRNTVETSRRLRWFSSLAFRRAMSKAIDRDGIVRLVYRDRASPVASNVSPGNERWLNQDLALPVRSVAQARTLLAAAGFTWDSEERLHDSSGEPVRFSLITSASNSERNKMAAIIQQDLAELGMAVEVQAVDSGTLSERLFATYDYDAALLGLRNPDADPNPQLPFLLSTGSMHLWNMNESPPLSPWQAEIDQLMQEQLVEMDYTQRKRMYDRVQELMYENEPVIHLVSPHLLTGAQLSVGNFKPARLPHVTLWNVEELFLRY